MDWSQLRAHDYALLEDGSLFSVHDLLPATETIVGEIAFTPNPIGTYAWHGTHFSKPYIDTGRGHRVSNSAKRRSRQGIARNPILEHFPTKAVIQSREVVGIITSEDIFKDFRESASGELQEDLSAAIQWLRELSAFRQDLALSLTGSAVFGPHHSIHDLDLVCDAPSATLGLMVRGLQEFSQNAPEARLHEWGKSWRHRISMPFGILCPFFRPAAEASLANVEIHEVIARDFTVTGVVTNAEFCATTPMILNVSTSTGDVLVVDMDLRPRADFQVGDSGVFRGVLAGGEWYGPRTMLLAGSSGGSRVTSPPWEPYYE